jgi:hypothetical protein
MLTALVICLLVLANRVTNVALMMRVKCLVHDGVSSIRGTQFCISEFLELYDCSQGTMQKLHCFPQQHTLAKLVHAALSYSLAHLAEPYGGRQGARLEPK